MAEKKVAKRNRREEILQALAQMLESGDGSQRITTAKLAAHGGRFRSGAVSSLPE
ncbi:Synthetically lethal with a defective Min system protein A [Pantoea agglomerans]|uniref:Synthetically lethal with a defective Min system protein A n=1 Tax=Enterobacter agglomerans TaxID=549 RepID=A0A379A937_ENTAG|nr:Synthetically lethal with a defective Min system protein A [Pantoea agglomerans]